MKEKKAGEKGVEGKREYKSTREVLEYEQITKNVPAIC